MNQIATDCTMLKTSDKAKKLIPETLPTLLFLGPTLNYLEMIFLDDFQGFLIEKNSNKLKTYRPLKTDVSSNKFIFLAWC